MNKTQEINDKPESKLYFPKFALKAKYAAYTTLIFFLVANPETYITYTKIFRKLGTSIK